jgi:hypothetical protein
LHILQVLKSQQRPKPKGARIFILFQAAEQAAEKLKIEPVLYQGTASAVPQKPQNKCGL